MGTNYYANIHECDHCGRVDTVHIGKSGNIVHAYDGDGLLGEIRSWSDWKRILAETPHTITDEYGDTLTDDQIIAIFESTSQESRRRQYDWVQAHCSQLVRRDYWLDGDGFTMSLGEWS